MAIGGVETNVLEVAKRFVKAGNKVEIISSDLLNFEGLKDDKRCFDLGGISVRKLYSLRSPHNFLDPYHLIIPGLPMALIGLGKRTILHVRSFPAFHAYMAMSLGHMFECIVFTPHFDIKDMRGCARSFSGRMAFNKLRKLLLTKEKAFITADTELEKNAYIHEINMPLNKVMHIPNGVNLEDFDAVNQEIIALRRKSLNIHPDDLVIGFVGRIAKVKGLDILLKAVSKLNRSNHCCPK
ncbi:MAG: glycosyltransferase [bacterium]|jgi:glycosyltransferase involved in cell wall biosynthesis